MMVGICGTSKAGVTHHYYACRAQRKHQCKKRAVRQDWIEGIVLRHLTRLVKNMDLLEFIAESTYQYYLAQNTDTTYTNSLQKALDETERAIANLLRAIEAGIFTESTKDRMNELQEQKTELKTALAAAKLKEDLGLKKEHILFFLHQFTNMDYTDIDCQKRLIKTFLNSVFVYDDKVVLTFNYSGDDRTITLHEIDGGLGHSICIPSAVVHHDKSLLLLQEVFVVYGHRRVSKTHKSAGKVLNFCVPLPISGKVVYNIEYIPIYWQIGICRRGPTANACTAWLLSLLLLGTARFDTSNRYRFTYRRAGGMPPPGTDGSEWYRFCGLLTMTWFLFAGCVDCHISFVDTARLGHAPTLQRTHRQILIYLPEIGGIP